MLLTLYNLPPHMRYADVKSLILSKCGVKEVILDNLVADGRNSKKVTVGLAEEEDAALLVRQINGLYLEGRQLYVEDVRKKKPSDQPFLQSHNNYVSSNADTDRSNYQQSSYPPQMNYAQQMSYQQSQYPGQMTGVEPDNFGNQQIVNPEQVMPLMMPYMAGMNMGGMYYMPQGQKSYMNYSGESQQMPSIANQYPQFSGQQGQTGSGLGSQNLEEDKSRERWTRIGASKEDNENNHGIQPTYKSDTTPMSGGWARGREMETSRHRSRSPRNKRERPRGGSGISPKRARNDDDNDRDSSRKGSNSNRDSRRDPYERDDTYTSQTYGKSNQSRPYYEYNNDPVTATSSNNRPQPLMSIPTQWNSGTNNPKFQQQKSGGLSDSTASFKDKSQVASWDSKDTSSLDNKSNYRKHMQMKASQNQSKNISKKPKKNKGKGKASVMPIIRQDSTSRFKAASQIATEIANAHPDIIKPEHLKHLRQSVRSRFEILLAARVGESLPLMIAIYRAKFPASQDREFCRLVVEQAEAESNTTLDLTDPDVKTEVKQEKPNPQVAKNQPSAGNNRPPAGRNRPPAGRNQPPAGRNQPPAGRYQPPAGRNQPPAGRNQPPAERNQPPAGRNQPGNRQQTQNQYNQVALPRLQLPDPMEKLPKYPNADKQVYKEQKKLKKLEHQNEDLYTLTPHLQQALDEELKNISDIFKRVVSNADTEQEKDLCERFLSIGLEQVRKKFHKAHSKALETSTPEASEARGTSTPEDSEAQKSTSMFLANTMAPDSNSTLDTSKSTTTLALEDMSSASGTAKAEFSVVTPTPGADFEDSPKGYQSGGTGGQKSERDNRTSQPLPCNTSSEPNHVQPPKAKKSAKKSKKKQLSGAQRRKRAELRRKQAELKQAPPIEQKTSTVEAPVLQSTVTSATSASGAPAIYPVIAPEVVKLNVTKRLLNITTNLIIRVLVSGRPPKKQEVELFLRKHKVVSLKKSDRKKIVYVATCNDFNTYDTLLQMGSAPLNHETVLRFKPFQLVGPKLSFRERNEQRLQRLRGLEGNSGNNTETAPDNYYEDITDPNEVKIKNNDERNEEEFNDYSAEPNEDIIESSAGLDMDEIMDNLKKEQQEQVEQHDQCDDAENIDDIDDEDLNEEDFEDY